MGEEGGWVEGGARQQQLYLANGRSRKKKDVGAGVCYYRYITDVKDYPTGRKTEKNGLRLNSIRVKTKTTTFLEYQLLFLEGEAGDSGGVAAISASAQNRCLRSGGE